ncbi:type II toxin-antitoxin system RelE/ParE family toxin [Azospirillum halopraeferens]|uniref:type II toxin-antitoxin system RelE/ParE family toxin n=1 Tax=Azospirillum halopraeferens TaxID=34010 RepID=UPI00048CB098|nr:type II toxin-antitoxin system RelE/ParE family toxin [Azospirillum halopraeferens]
MIRTFRSKPLRRFFETGDAARLSVPNIGRIVRIIRALDAATKPDDMNLPGFHFHGLEGSARWSVRVTGNRRLTFGWNGTDAVDVDLEDYH